MSQSQVLSWEQVYHLYQGSYEVIERNKPYQMWIALEQLIPCHDDELTIMMCAAGICGTDLRVYTGDRPVPAGRIGHEGVAIIIDVGSKAKEKGYRRGMCVVIDCNHPDPQKRDLHLDGVLGRFYRVPADFVMCEPQRRIIPIDSERCSGRIAPATAALVEPMTVALHALDYLKWGSPKPREFYDHFPTEHMHPDRLKGKNIVITGAGSIAVFTACLARINQAKSVTLVNRDHTRLAHAVKVAQPDYFFVDDDDVCAKLREHFREKGGVDYVLVASHTSAIRKATQYINPYGTILLVAGIGKEDILQTDTEVVQLYPIRHDDLEKKCTVDGKPLKLMGAHGTTEPLFHEVLSYLSQGAFEKYGLNPLDQVSHVVSLAALPQVFALATGGNTIRETLVGKILVDFRLEGHGIYTRDEYTSLFPQASKDFFTATGLSAIEHYDAKRIRTKNTFASIRSFMDALKEKLEERYRVREHKELSAKERKFLEKAFVVANDAYREMSNERRFRPDGTQFIFHPLEMADYAITHLSCVDPSVIAGILLHDTLEYTQLDTHYLSEQFGESVAAIASDLAQDKRAFETMALEDVCEYLQKNAFVPFLQEVGRHPEQRQREHLVNLALKNEHYSRLISASKYPSSPVLKVLDTSMNYSWVRELPASQLKRRSQEEIALFKAFVAACSNAYALPRMLQEDAYDVSMCYERIESNECH